MANKRLQNAVLGCSLKNNRMISDQTIQHQSNTSLCPNHWCQRSWSWMVLWRPPRPSRSNSQKGVLFIIGDWNAKAESQEIPGVTRKFGLGVQNEAGQRLTNFYQEKALVIANSLFQQHKRWFKTCTLAKWSILKSDWLYSLQPKREKLYTVSRNKTWSWLWLRASVPYCKIQVQIKESRTNH